MTCNNWFAGNHATQMMPAPSVCTVAICDDRPEIRLLLATLLEREHDITVVGEARNGREAIDLVREQRPDLLLLDIAMPVMDGLEAIPHIIAASPQTSIIMLSAFAAPETREQALRLGAVDYVQKGSGIDVIADAIRGSCKAGT